MMERDFDNLVIHPVARIRTGFYDKFGIPRQGVVASKIKGRIILEEEYRKDGVFKGLDGYSHLILVWGFSKETEEKWSPTVRPPKLGGNTRVGVFASRSPNRPNPLGISIVKIEEIHPFELLVSGVDMVDDTPIYDIKPYLAYADSFPDAKSGYSIPNGEKKLNVSIPDNLIAIVSAEKKDALYEVLENDPRPGYQKEPDRIYEFEFDGYHISFQVKEKDLIVTNIVRLDKVDR